MQEKSADCGKNGTFLVESQKSKSRKRREPRTGRRKEGECGELYSPEKEERRVSGLNPDVMDEEDEQNSMNND